MKIVIPGGTGHIGRHVARHWSRNGHDVVVLSRYEHTAPWKVVRWDGETIGDWIRELDGADVVLNLAGRTVNCRYTAQHKCEILESRVRSVRVLHRAIQMANTPPALWIQAGTATIYAHQYGEPHSEASGVIGGLELDTPKHWRFSIDVASAWEGEFERAHLPKTRQVLLRTSLVLSPDRGSVYSYLTHLVRLRLGGAYGDGRQYVSWVHIRDFLNALDWIVSHSSIHGVINIASPNSITNRDMMRVLRTSWGVTVGIPIPEPVLHIGAILLGTETELMLKSRKVAPARLLDSGFKFEFPDFVSAANNLRTEWGNSNGTR